MPRSKFRTTYRKEDGGEGVFEGLEGPTIKLLKRLARKKVIARTVQVGEAEAEGGTVQCEDGKVIWHLTRILRGKRKLTRPKPQQELKL